MLVVKVEVHPGGSEELAKRVAELYIWNVSKLAEVSNYLYSFNDPRPAIREGADHEYVADGAVTNHRRSKGPWVLIRRVLAQARCADCHEAHRRYLEAKGE